MRNFYTLILLILLGLNYNTTAATFSSVASGTWSAPATWTITAGTDIDGIPDMDDDVIVNIGHNISMTSFLHSCKSMSNAGVLIGNSKKFYLYGNFSNTGSASNLVIYIQAPCQFSSSTFFSGALSWWVYQPLTINSGTSVFSSNTMAIFSTVTNFGSFNVQGGLSMNTNGKWINESASTLTLSGNCTSTGTLDASSFGNTVTYQGSSGKQIKQATYYNLTLNGSASTSRQAQGDLIVLNNLTIGSGYGYSFNMNHYNLTVGGNWLNQSNSDVLNQSTTTFNSSSSQLINRTSSGNEVFNNVVIAGTGTTLLGKSINVTQNLTVSSGTLDVSASNYTLNVGGNITNNGFINCRSGLINLNGTLAQTISGTSNTQFYALTLNNASGAIVNSPQSVTDVLTITNGNFNSNGNLTLVSNASKTARLGIVGSGGSFSGNMFVQKHIPTRTGSWTDFSSPVQGTTIFDWDDEMYMSGFSSQDVPTGIAGVDGSAAGFKSVKTYNEPTAAYANVTNSTTVLSPGRGYEIWLADALNGNWNAKTIDSRGVPNFGTQNISLSYSGSAGAYAGLNLVGNPFASAINYSSVTKTNTDGHAYGYNNGVWTDFGTNAVLTPHQGFWVYATGAGASISIPENAKSTVTATSFYRLAPDYAIKLIYTNSDIEFYNEAKVNLDDKASEKWDIGLDAIYFNSPEAQASTINFNTGDRKLLTNAVNDKQDNVTLPIELFSPKVGLYYIQPSILNIGEYKYVWIENTKTGEKFDLNKSIPVNIDETGENNDFVLRLSKNQESSQISQAVFANDLMIFNSENNLNLKSNKSNHQLSQISVFDLSGKLVFEQKDITIEENSTYKFDISSLNQGVYIVNVVDVTGNSMSKKIIK